MVDDNRAQRLRLVTEPTPGSSERTLVAALRERRAGAADLFFALFGRRINRLVWRLLGADPEHDDVVQQVFVNVLSSIRSLRDPDLLEPWVLSVAANTVRREIRSRYYRRLLRLEAEPLERPAAIGPVEDLVTRRFYAVLATLGPEDRMIIGLHYLAEHSLPEVAAMMGQSLATAKRRLQRAKRRLLNRARQDPLLSREELP